MNNSSLLLLPLELVDIIYDKLYIEFITENYMGEWVDYSSPIYQLFYEKRIKMEKYWDFQGIYNLIFRGDLSGIKYIVENFNKYGVKENLNHYILEASQSSKNSLKMIQYFVSLETIFKIYITNSLYLSVIMAIINDDFELVKYIIDIDSKRLEYNHFPVCNAGFICKLANDKKKEKILQYLINMGGFMVWGYNEDFINELLNEFPYKVEYNNHLNMDFYYYFLQDNLYYRDIYGQRE